MNIGGLGASVKTTLNTEPVTNFVKTNATSKVSYESPVKMMTGAELIEKMGSPPKANVTVFGKVLYEHSGTYRGALEGLEKYEKLLNLVKNESAANGEVVLPKMKEALNEALSYCAGYIEEHEGNDKKAGRRDAMLEMGLSIQEQIKHIDTVTEQLSLHRGTFDSKTSLGAALAMLKGGVDDPSLVNKSMSDANLIGEPRRLGSGAINTVSLATYRTVDGGTETRVLKPLINEKPAGMGKDSFIGIDENDLRAGQRNLASATVANLLGQSNMIPMPEIVIHNDQLCLAMPLAEGEDLLGTRDVVLPHDTQLVLNEWEKNNDKQSIEMMRARKNEDNVWVSGTDAVKDFPTVSSEPSELTGNLQKAMLDLQVVDLLCGQVDRHQHNFLVKIDGNEVKLTGIDNDTSFGSKSATVTNITTDSPPRIVVPWPGLPPLMSTDMFDKLMALQPEDLQRDLEKTGLKANEIDATLVRLDLLKDHARSLEANKCIVDDFTSWSGVDPTSGNRMNASDFIIASKNGSYVKQFEDLKQGLSERGTPVLPLDNSKHVNIG